MTRSSQFGRRVCLTLAAATLASFGFLNHADAAVSSASLVFPPSGATFQQTAGTSVLYPTLGYSISGLTFKPTTNGTPLSSSNDTVVDSWPSAGSLQFGSSGATGTSKITCTSNLTLSPDQQASSYRFKLVAVKTISWSYDDDVQKRVRLSPTVPSTGEFDYAVQPDGTYQISSFLNLNTQVSFDSGASWTDGATPLHLDLVAVPEPASAALLLAALPVAMRRRKVRTS